MLKNNDFNPYILLTAETFAASMALLDKINGIQKEGDSVLLSNFFEFQETELKDVWKDAILPFYTKELNTNLAEDCKAAILQLKHTDENHYRLFSGLRTLNNVLKEEPNAENYELVHLKTVSSEEISEKLRLCNKLYSEYNADSLRPANYYGHSLCVSDIIVLCDKSNFSSYYVDDFGFKKLPDNFLSEIMKNKILYNLDIRLEHDTLSFLANEMELPFAHKSRLDIISNDYKRIFEMATKRGEILKKRKTDPLYGEFKPFDKEDYDTNKEYFAIGKEDEASLSFNIYTETDSHIKIFEKGIESLQGAKDFISTLAQQYDYYVEHPVVLVSMEDLKEICKHKESLKENNLENKIKNEKQEKNRREHKVNSRQSNKTLEH